MYVCIVCTRCTVVISPIEKGVYLGYASIERRRGGYICKQFVGKLITIIGRETRFVLETLNEAKDD